SYARAIAVSRQLMINDDLGAIQDMLSSYGSTVALFEEITFYSSALNAKLADGQTVFHASHNNLAGAGAAIDVTTVSNGRAAMAKQKSLDDNPLLSNSPSIILTGPDTITAAEMLVASITPATAQTVNIFSGRLTPIDTAQIAGNPWYLFPNPEAGSNYRWGYLEGYEAPRVRIENPFG
ncbi:Clp protease ClpP, partial [Rhizobium leguminosarum]|nr:Clp protease ClpP [Rhizobium leguminosarum]